MGVSTFRPLPLFFFRFFASLVFFFAEEKKKKKKKQIKSKSQKGRFHAFGGAFFDRLGSRIRVRDGAVKKISFFGFSTCRGRKAKGARRSSSSSYFSQPEAAAAELAAAPPPLAAAEEDAAAEPPPPQPLL